MDEAALIQELDEPATGCASCGTPSADPVFAIGDIALRCPSPAVQRECEFECDSADVSLPAGTAADYARLVTVLERRADLARLICWVFSTQGMERFYLQPRTERELQTLIDAVRPDKDGRVPGTHAVVGWLAGRQNCGGIELPVALVETSYHFDLPEFFDAMFAAVGAGKKNKAAFLAAASEVFQAITGIGGNDGLGRFRALNWAAVRFAPLYDLVYKAGERDEMLRSVETRASGNATSERLIVELLLSFEPRKSGPVTRHRLAIDLSDLYPHPLGQAFTQAYDF